MPLKPEDSEDVLNELRIKLPGSSDAGIKLELFGVIKEFLQDSNSWLENIELMVTAGTQSYALVPRKGGQIIRLGGVWDGLGLPVHASMPNFGTLTVHQSIQVTSVAQAESDTSRKATTPWTVNVIKNTSLPTTKDAIPVAPDFVLQVYSTYIMDGVLGKMMSQTSKSYTNVQMGVYHLKRFRDGISIARDAAFNQNLFGGQRWQFPQNFATASQRSGVSTAWPTETY